MPFVAISFGMLPGQSPLINTYLLGRFWSHEFIQVTLKHSVVYLSVFVGLTSDILFGIFEACDDETGPGIKSCHGITYHLVDGRHSTLFFKALSVRRIGYDKTVLLCTGKVLDISCLKMDLVVYSGEFGILACGGDYVGV